MGRQACLGDVADFVNGAAFKPEDWGDNGHPIIRIQNLTDRSKPFNRTRRSVNEKLYVNPGDLLVSWSATLGVFEWDRAETGVLNQHIFRVIPDSSKIDKAYLRHAVVVALLAMQRHLHGATMQHVNRGEFLSTPLHLPPLPEQRRIAAVLDQADALRAKRREALAQLDSLTHSIFIEMFGGSLLSPNRTPMGDLVEEFRYGTSEKSGDSGFPALRIPNVANGHLNLIELKTVPVEAAEFRRLQLKSGDLLFVRTNGNPENVGRCAVFEPSLVEGSGFNPAEFIYASYLIRARLKARTVSPVVLQQYLHVGEGRHALRAICKTSAGQYNVNTEGLGAIPIPIFPNAPQETFATHVRAVESLKATHRAAMTELDVLFASLQHRAFAGQLS